MLKLPFGFFARQVSITLVCLTFIAAPVGALDLKDQHVIESLKNIYVAERGYNFYLSRAEIEKSVAWAKSLVAIVGDTSRQYGEDPAYLFQLATGNKCLKCAADYYAHIESWADR